MFPTGRTSWPAAAVGLLAAGLAACQQEEPSFDSSGGGEPELQILASATCGNALPVMTRQDVDSGQLETATIQVQGIDPAQPNRQMVPGTDVILYVGNQAGELGDGTGRFVSNPSPDNPRRVTSRGIKITGGQATDQFFCTSASPPVVYLHAIVQNYPVGGGQTAVVRTRPGEGFPIRCLPAEEWECQCFGCPDAAIPLDGGPGDGDGGAGDADVGPDAQRAPDWSLEFVGASSERLEIGIRGSYREGRTDSIDLTFRVTERGGPPSRRFRVRFGLGAQSLSGVAVQPEEAETNAEGYVTVQLRAGTTPGVVSVSATTTFPGSDEPETVNSPPIVIRGGIPSQRGFGFQCEFPVISAFSNRMARMDGPDNWLLALGENTTCFAQLADRLGGRVDQETQVFFLSEAGNVNQSTTTDEEGVAITVLRVGPPVPFDTEPHGWERELAGGGGFNPRDGLVRVVAATRGEENFIDRDGNKFYEPDIDLFLPEHDMPEPFVDANDNGQRDEREDFRDLNNNGIWDSSNGVWDNSTEIWVDTNVLWVGNLSDMSVDFASCDGVSGCSTDGPGELDCPNGLDFYLSDRGSARLTFRADDDNGNCLNGFGEGSITINATPPLEVLPRSVRSFDISTEDCFRGPCGPNCPVAATYSFALVDTVPLPPPQEGQDPPLPQNVEVSISLNYRAAGGERRQVTYSLVGCVE